jgi:hypothetical protein
MEVEWKNDNGLIVPVEMVKLFRLFKGKRGSAWFQRILACNQVFRLMQNNTLMK